MRAFPTTMEVKEDVLFIQRVRPATTVTLPLNRIASFSVMEEENFMLKYHGQAISTSKVKGIKKILLSYLNMCVLLTHGTVPFIRATGNK